MVVGALETAELNDLVRELQAAKVHIHLSNGVRGINYRRLRAVPIAHEPLFYVEQVTLQRRQIMAKRALDLVGAFVGLILASPLLAAIALSIKLNDRGPVFFKQTRVGQDGEHFKVFKFRTMVVDAEAKLRELQATNERTGPLFKMDRDPRVTRVGRLPAGDQPRRTPPADQRAAGRDEPRRAPAGAARRRPPSSTNGCSSAPRCRRASPGMWQVEARDNPSFSAYRRLDLFYVDNWSISLDFVILIATVEQVVAKAVRSISRRKPVEDVVDATIAPANRAA